MPCIVTALQLLQRTDDLQDTLPLDLWLCYILSESVLYHGRRRAPTADG